ncbi:50S ribosomal protein L29 [Sodalis-like secondary symbiont of Drepanosiphum platanoidis]|uniref:50S ribosomal protein L29 n=1 Tax=Sodalis-like secondary symbiont of Drepanosiphum platanoidis TaxID=2994493 RepID=UPI003463A1BC
MKKNKKKYILKLKNELLCLCKEQFNLKMRMSSKQLNQTHLIKKVRKKISRIKTLLSCKEKI